MSTIEPEDLEAAGHFLPEDAWLRLTKLREHVQFLANLARPRTRGEDKARTAEIRGGDVFICLELLEEQIGRVLDELPWPAERGGRAAAREADAAYAEAAEADTSEPATDEAGNRCLFGVTLNQIDEIGLLLDSLLAHGNVVTCSDHAELKDVTLSIMGDAIVRDAQALRDIVGDINAQELEPPRGTRPGVREEQATYLAPPARLPSGGASCVVRQHPTYQ